MFIYVAEATKIRLLYNKLMMDNGQPLFESDFMSQNLRRPRQKQRDLLAAGAPEQADPCMRSASLHPVRLPVVVPPHHHHCLLPTSLIIQCIS